MTRMQTIVLAVALAAAGAVAPPSLRGVKEAASGEIAEASLAMEPRQVRDGRGARAVGLGRRRVGGRRAGDRRRPGRGAGVRGAARIFL